MTAKTTAERQKTWRERKKKLGLRRVCGYVRQENVPRAKKLLRRLRTS